MDLKVFIDDLVDLVQRAFLERSFFFLNQIERKKLNSKRDGGDDDSRLANNIDFLKRANKRAVRQSNLLEAFVINPEFVYVISRFTANFFNL